MSYSILAIINRILCPSHSVRISSALWRFLVAGLQVRGERRRESGAFLLGTIDSDKRRRIERIVFYDDLCPNAFANSYVEMTPEGYGRLWPICERTSTQVVADVHTHPGKALQSSSDRAHPMIVLRGHIAMIIPFYAEEADIKSVGVFEYLGDRRWRTLSDLRQPSRALYVAPRA